MTSGVKLICLALIWIISIDNVVCGEIKYDPECPGPYNDPNEGWDAHWTECYSLWERIIGPNNDTENCESHAGQFECRFNDYHPWILPPNMPILQGVHCALDGSGICKAFAGRYEFKFSINEDLFLGPVLADESDSFRNQYGYLERVPANYDENGNINYIDQSINWATERQRSNSERDKKINLMSSKDFNWCAYVDNNYWPYKSVIRDSVEGSDYLVYFFNRQSCIVNKKTGLKQHYNTRWQYNTSLRIDLDMNPLIFSIKDPVAGGEIRMVKNKRQHWYEVRYRVREAPAGSPVNMYLEVDDLEKEPCLINKTSPIPLISRLGYFKPPRTKNYYCLSDRWHKRTGPLKNHAILVPVECGLDQVESADLTYPQSETGKKQLLEIQLHNLARFPRSNALFFGLDVAKARDWEVFAKDGYTFTATTTVPYKNDKNRVKVINLFSKYLGLTSSKSQFDEYYPMPMLSIFDATYYGEGVNNEWGSIQQDRERSLKEVKHLNYVDDIAYLHSCETILVIFGVFYTEFPHEKFGMEEKARIDSIYHLGIWELANAFFAEPGKNHLWIYHRTNWVTLRYYTCAKDSNSLVTAVKTDDNGRYYPRHGLNRPSFMSRSGNYIFKLDPSEEQFYLNHGLLEKFTPNLDPRAPDPALYPLQTKEVPVIPVAPKSYTYIYVLIGVGLLLALAMCAIGTLAIRSWRKRQLGKAEPSGTSTLKRPGGSSGTRTSIFQPERSMSLGRITKRSSMTRPVSASKVATRRSTLTKLLTRPTSLSLSGKRGSARFTTSAPPEKSRSRSRSSSSSRRRRRSTSMKR